MNRRDFIRLSSTALAMAPGIPAWAASTRKVPIGAAFDREVEAFMSARKIPGGAIAVVKDGRLVYTRGYGWADREKKITVGPESLFRIASISKPITAVAVMKLIQDGKLSLDTRAFEFLGLKPSTLPGGGVESRLNQITVRHLLQHTAGWDWKKTFDPMFRSNGIARSTNSPRPATPEKIIEYMLGQPLQSDPGTRYAYANFDYCLLGRIIEKITGKTYEAHVRKKILAPMGIKRMRIGATLEEGRTEGEVRYYMVDGSPAKNVFPSPPDMVPWPYGGFHLEAMDAHGGWIASAVDLARFAAALDLPARNGLLKAETLNQMYAPPPPPVSRSETGELEERYYGCGWMVRPKTGGKASYWHSGSLPGTATLLVRRWDGLSWAVLFNQRSEDNKLPDDAIDGALHQAANAVEKWPDYDLFRQFS